MARFRRAVARVVVVWLSCQIASAACAPIWTTSGGHDIECHCTHGADATCPMHHTPAPGSKICVMRAAPGNATIVFASLFGVAGLVPTPAHPADPHRHPQALVLRHRQPISYAPVPPDPPPPRA